MLLNSDHMVVEISTWVNTWIRHGLVLITL
jgi:hypothetical protein